LLFEQDGTFSLNQDEPVRFSRPSIDLCFQSAAEVFGSRVIGVILTGANNDGAEGLRAIKAAGGVTIVQNPESAEFPEMPSSALSLQKPDYVVKVSELPQLFLSCQTGASL
jgi:two-component system chemotaxis response regulator CheB